MCSTFKYIVWPIRVWCWLYAGRNRFADTVLSVNQWYWNFSSWKCEITLEQLSLYLILFADDMVIFSDTPEGLQLSLDRLQRYCDSWNLTVNSDKTNVMVFRKGGMLSNNEQWFYNGVILEIIKSKKISNDQELIQSYLTSCPQNQQGNN